MPIFALSDLVGRSRRISATHSNHLWRFFGLQESKCHLSLERSQPDILGSLVRFSACFYSLPNVYVQLNYQTNILFIVSSNVFFFTLVIIISLFFPPEIYVATFYISIIGIYFTASLALVVLFAPKFFNLWKAHHGDDDDDDSDSFAIRDHGQLGKTVLRGVTNIHQAARMTGTRDSGSGDNPGFSTYARSPADLQTTPSIQPGLTDRSLTIPANTLLGTDQLSSPGIMPASNERNRLDQVLGVATPISITSYSQQRYSGSSIDDWVNRVIPKLDKRGEIVSPIDNDLGLRELRGTFIDSSEIMAFRQLQVERSSENIASSSSMVLSNQDSANLTAQYSNHDDESMCSEIKQEEEVVVAPGNGTHRMVNIAILSFLYSMVDSYTPNSLLLTFGFTINSWKLTW